MLQLAMGVHMHRADTRMPMVEGFLLPIKHCARRSDACRHIGSSERVSCRASLLCRATGAPLSHAGQMAGACARSMPDCVAAEALVDHTGRPGAVEPGARYGFAHPWSGYGGERVVATTHFACT